MATGRKNRRGHVKSIVDSTRFLLFVQVSHRMPFSSLQSFEVYVGWGDFRLYRRAGTQILALGKGKIGEFFFR